MDGPEQENPVPRPPPIAHDPLLRLWPDCAKAPHESRRQTIITAAISSMILAIFSVTPIFWRWLVADTIELFEPWDRWIYILLLAATLQVGYAILVLQIPRRITLRISTLFQIGLTCVYAAALSVFTFGSDGNWFISSFDLTDEHHLGQPTSWCIIVTSLLLVQSYLSGKVGFQR